MLFDELLPQQAVTRLEETIASGPGIVISIGTIVGFPCIAEPVLHAAQRATPNIEINPGDGEVSDFVQHRFQARGIEVLPYMAGELGVSILPEISVRVVVHRQAVRF